MKVTELLPQKVSPFTLNFHPKKFDLSEALQCEPNQAVQTKYHLLRVKIK